MTFEIKYSRNLVIVTNIYTRNFCDIEPTCIGYRQNDLLVLGFWIVDQFWEGKCKYTYKHCEKNVNDLHLPCHFLKNLHSPCLTCKKMEKCKRFSFIVTL